MSYYLKIMIINKLIINNKKKTKIIDTICRMYIPMKQINTPYFTSSLCNDDTDDFELI